MGKKPFLITAALAALTGISFAVQGEELIASISEPEGKVLVNQGEDIVTARAGMPLRSGDRVITLEKARVAVVYSNKCVIRLEENSLLALKNANECRTGAVTVRNVGAYQNQAIGQAIGAGGATLGWADALVISGAVGSAALYSSEIKDESSASPD